VVRFPGPRSRMVFLATGVWLAGCATGPNFQEPVVGTDTATHDELLELPPPRQKVAVAVYAFEDETGQFEFSDTVQTLSRAVTQGATSVLIEALLKAGNGSWFTVVEREGLDNLLRERQIIRETRALYEGNGDLSRNYLPPLLFAGMLLEGGIIGYDTNTMTGGLGAALLGIGGSTKFRQDTVTVYLRAISTQSGEVLESVNVSKTIFSLGLNANVFRFISSDEILEVDAGISTNEPEQIAVTQTIEKAVIALVLQGAERGRWGFSHPDTAAALLDLPVPTEEANDAPASPAVAVRPAGFARTRGAAGARTPAPLGAAPGPSRRGASAPTKASALAIDHAAGQAHKILIAEPGHATGSVNQRPGGARSVASRRPG
jgi:curli production assembly/transport component CsgG